MDGWRKPAKPKQRFDGMGNPLDKSYDSMESNEKDPVHYELDSDNEPPKDEVGDVLVVVAKGQVTKEILEVRDFLWIIKIFNVDW